MIVELYQICHNIAHYFGDKPNNPMSHLYIEVRGLQFGLCGTNLMAEI